MHKASHSEWAIRCEHLTRTYGEVTALDDLSLTIEPGSIFGYLGRNGAGKTTTMRLLTGQARPTSGRAWLDGVETLPGDNPSRGRFGYLPQSPVFYGWMTPREYLDYVGRLHSMDSTERGRRADEVLDLMGLVEVANRRIRGFSGGMQQRLGIAQALLHEPPILFLDEPTNGLDPAGRHEILDLIAGLRGSVTVFLSSHIIVDVDRICDTIGVLHRGRLLQVTSRENLLAEHAVDAIVLEPDPSCAPQCETFVTALNAQPWVSRVTRHNGTIHVTVNDAETGKREILPLLVQHDVVINRQEWVRPSLEEIFLEMSG